MRVLGLSLLLSSPAVALPVSGGADARPVQTESVSVKKDFPDAVADGAIRRVCATTVEILRRDFADRAAPFEPGLVRSRGGRRCHVDYAPSQPGFRADPDEQAIQELFVNVDGLSFLAGRSAAFGDSLDISKAMVAKLPRRIPITLGTQWELPDAWYERAAAEHYGSRSESIDWRQGRVASLTHPWTQDYLKSGRVGNQRRILVTRRLFEGRREDGETFRPMLDALNGERFVRSRLSWEGGDVQFVRHPLNPGQLVMLFGDAAKTYWGEELTAEEYAYVLRREFGADVGVDLSGLVPHVDYAVAFLPADRIVLVSQPVRGHRLMAEAAAAALEERFEGGPPATLTELRRQLQREEALTRDRRRTERLLRKAREDAEKGWPRVVDRHLESRMQRHLAAHCPASFQDCFDEKALEAFLVSEPELLREWTAEALRERTESAMDLRLLSVVESQLLRRPARSQERLDEAVRVLESMGFRVVKVPRFGGDRELKVPWSGLSYVNGLLVDHTLFVPRMGLGRPEEEILRELDRSLPPEYEVIPVYARHMLLHNGGVHCTVAIVRE